jgi:hypothetical protein
MKKLLILTIVFLFIFTSCCNHKERTVCGKIISMTKLEMTHINDMCRISVYDTNKIAVSEEFKYEGVENYKVGDSICLVIYE